MTFEELKTLKEIKQELIIDESINKFEKKLKTEAVKHWKAIEEKKCKWSRFDVLNLIEYFFNLTKEDLTQSSPKEDSEQ